MAEAREKHQELLEKIGEAVLGQYNLKDLNVFTGFFKQSWANGTLVFGRGVWPREGNRPVGLWVDYLSFDCLASDEKDDALEAYVYVGAARRKARLDVVAAKRKLWQELPKLLTAEERQSCLKHEDEKDCLVGWRFSSKQEFLGWIRAGDEPKLTECIQDQVAIFVKLVPLLNDLLRSDKAEKSSASPR